MGQVPDRRSPRCACGPQRLARERQREERAQGALYRRMFAAEEEEGDEAEADGREAGCWRRLLELVGRLVGARWGGKGEKAV